MSNSTDKAGKKSAQRKIVMTGGHLTPALSLILHLKEISDYRIYFLGRKHSFEGDSSLSLEYKTIGSLGLDFYSIRSGRLQRSFSIYSLLSLVKIPLGFIQSVFYLSKIRPGIVISFGGYLGFVVCLAARFLGIRFIIHEQTKVMGLSNRILSRFAYRVCLSHPETLGYEKSDNTVVTGNPILKKAYRQYNYLAFGDNKRKLIYVTGGSTGSLSLNNAIFNALEVLLGSYRILHQTGSAQNRKSYLKAVGLKNHMEKDKARNYLPVENISPLETVSIYKEASLVIGRSGANTVAEICFHGIPAVFVPLPWAGEGEQLANASFLEKQGRAVIITQDKLTDEKLISSAEMMIRLPATPFQRKNDIQDPAEKLTQVIHDAFKD